MSWDTVIKDNTAAQGKSISLAEIRPEQADPRGVSLAAVALLYLSEKRQDNMQPTVQKVLLRSIELNLVQHNLSRSMFNW